MSSPPGLNISVGSCRCSHENTEQFFTAPIGLTRDVNNRKNGPFLASGIGIHRSANLLGQMPTFQDADLAAPGTKESVVKVWHNREQSSSFAAECYIGNQKGRNRR